MKKCNVCQSVVDEKSECPICGNTLTYEPPCMEDNEKFIFNRYYILYLIKNAWFSILCTVASIIIFVITKPTVNPYALSLLIATAIALIASNFFAFFKRNISRRLLWKYSKEYAVGRIITDKYIYGIFAVICIIFAGVLS